VVLVCNLNAEFPSLGMLWGHMVAQLLEALCCKPGGCGFSSWWCHWYFSV